MNKENTGAAAPVFFLKEMRGKGSFGCEEELAGHSVLHPLFMKRR